MNGFSEQDFGVLARVLDSLTAMVNLKNHYDVYSAVEHAFRVCLEEEAQFAKLIGDEPNSWRAGLRLLHEFATEYKDSLQNQQYEELDEPGGPARLRLLVGDIFTLKYSYVLTRTKIV